MAREICVSDEDPFSAAAVRDARAVDDRLRELAPAVKLLLAGNGFGPGGGGGGGGPGPGTTVMTVGAATVKDCVA